MTTKRKEKAKDEAKEKPEPGGSAGRGKQQRELSRQELEQLRERLQKKFH
jgi:hypothetical protein